MYLRFLDRFSNHRYRQFPPCPITRRDRITMIEKGEKEGMEGQWRRDLEREAKFKEIRNDPPWRSPLLSILLPLA